MFNAILFKPNIFMSIILSNQNTLLKSKLNERKTLTLNLDYTKTTSKNQHKSNHDVLIKYKI